MIKKWVDLNFEHYLGKEAQLFDTIFTFTRPFSWYIRNYGPTPIHIPIVEDLDIIGTVVGGK